MKGEEELGMLGFSAEKRFSSWGIIYFVELLWRNARTTTTSVLMHIYTNKLLNEFFTSTLQSYAGNDSQMLSRSYTQKCTGNVEM